MSVKKNLEIKSALSTAGFLYFKGRIFVRNNVSKNS